MSLNFKGAGIFGRNQQVTELRQLLDHVCNTSSSHFGMVVGPSGTGKSRVVREALQSYCRTKCAVFVESKFDQIGKSPRPLSVFIDAMAQLYQNLSDQQWIRVKNVVKEDLSLVNVIPALADFADMDDFADNGETSPFAEEKVLNGYRDIIRAVVTKDNPTVIFLDDLQWADEKSLELIAQIACDAGMQHLLLLGAFRDNEVKHNDPLNMKLDDIRKKRDIHYIHVDNLDIDTICEWLQVVLDTSSASTRELAALVVQKTKGNIFFAIQFLESLRNRGKLQFDNLERRWTWCIDDLQLDVSENRLTSCIDEDSTFTRDKSDNNLMELVGETMLSVCGSLALLFLRVAACLGTKFSPTLAAHIVRHLYGLDIEAVVLDSLVENGLLEQDLNGWVKFSHDRIQEAASLILETDNTESRTSLHWKIGIVLVEAMESESLPLTSITREWLLFAAADQLNRGAACIFDKEDSVLLANLNLQAGELAKQKLAFSVAATYAEAGFDSLRGPMSWTSDYDTLLNLANLGAEMAYCNGNFQQCSAMTSIIFANARNLKDKLPAYFARVQMLVTSGKIDDGILECLNVLQLLGYKLASQPSTRHVLVAISKTALRLRGKSDNDLVSMLPMTDALQLAAMRFLSMASSYAGISKTKAMENVFVTTTCKLVDVTVVRGLCPHTPVAFATYAVLLRLLGIVNPSCWYSKVALRILEETEYKQHTAWTTNIAYCWGGLNRITIASSTSEPFLRAYHMGMKYGFVDDAVLSAGAHCESRILAAQPLIPLVADLRHYLRVMKNYRQATMHQAFVPYLQFCLNMMQKSPENRNRAILTGDAMDLDELLLQISASNNSMALGNLLSLRIALCYYHDEFETAATLASEFRKLCKREGTVSLTASCIVATFYEGLACLALLRCRKSSIRHEEESSAFSCYSQRRQYRSRSRRCIKFMEQQVQQAFPSWSLLLKAEQLSVNRKSTSPSSWWLQVQSRYIEAAECAALHDANNIRALAYERLADFIRSQGGGTNEKGYIVDSCCYYSSWGAISKVLALKNKHDIDSRVFELDWSTGCL